MWSFSKKKIWQGQAWFQIFFQSFLFPSQKIKILLCSQGLVKIRGRGSEQAHANSNPRRRRKQEEASHWTEEAGAPDSVPFTSSFSVLPLWSSSGLRAGRTIRWLAQRPVLRCAWEEMWVSDYGSEDSCLQERRDPSSLGEGVWGQHPWWLLKGKNMSWTYNSRRIWCEWWKMGLRVVEAA